MKRILINATHAEEVRVALCNGNHLYDFDLENRTREQKKANIYKGHVTRVEPSLEAVFVEYGSKKQGFLPIREIASEYLKGDPRTQNIREMIKEGDELIVQVSKEERGTKGAALSSHISLAGRYLVLMPNNPRGGGISRQISGKLRDDMKNMLKHLNLPKPMSVIIRTAGIGRSQEDLQADLDHLLSIWDHIQTQAKNHPSPRLMYQEAGVVTRAVRDYLRDDINEIWIDNEAAFDEASSFINKVMPKQINKLCKYNDVEPMFARFGIESQIETAYQREVKLPSGGSIVIDQTEALVAIDINSARATKGADVEETAYNTNLEAADEIARQLRLRDMGGLIVIDFIDMQNQSHQRDVEKRFTDATQYDRARIQFGQISKFGLLEMSRQRLRPSLEESTGFLCPRCHGNGMIRDLRSLSLSIMRQIEKIALRERQGEIQVEVPTDVAAFLLNEKRDSLIYLEQDSGTRITILPHSYLESPHFNLDYNRDGFPPSSYERVSDMHEQESAELGYEANWTTKENQHTKTQTPNRPQHHATTTSTTPTAEVTTPSPQATSPQPTPPAQESTSPVAWLSNLFAPAPQAQVTEALSNQSVAQAIETLVNQGATGLGMASTFDGGVPTAAPAQPKTTANLPEDKSSVSNHTDKDHKKSSGRYKNKKSKKPYNKHKSSDATRATDTRHKDNKPTETRPKVDTNDKTLQKRQTSSTSDQSSANHKDRQTKESNNTPSTSSGNPAHTTDSSKSTGKQHYDLQLNVNKNPIDTASGDTITIDLDGAHTQGKRNNDKSKAPSTPVPETSQTTSVATADTASKNQAALADTHTDSQPETAAYDYASVFAPMPSSTDTNVDSVTRILEQLSAEDSDKIDNLLATSHYDTADIFASVNPDHLAEHRVSNDPRAPQTSQTSQPLQLTGTAAQVIEQYLPDSGTDDNFVTRFIQAIEAAKQDLPQAVSYHVEQFQPLDDHTLAEYRRTITPVAQFGCAAGKTQVTPLDTSDRVGNDPRLSSDSSVATTDTDIDTSSEQTVTDTVSSETPSTSVETIVDTVTHYLPTSIGKHIAETLGQAGVDMMAAGQTVAAYLQSLTTQATPPETEASEQTADSLTPSSTIESESESESEKPKTKTTTTEKKTKTTQAATKKRKSPAKSDTTPKKRTRKAKTSQKTQPMSYAVGSSGALIESVLGDATTATLEKDGFVATFLKVVSTQQDTLSDD